MPKNTSEKKGWADLGQTGYVISAAVLLALLGLLLLFVPQIQIVYIVSLVSCIMIVVGIMLMIRYFIKESFRNLNQYDFSIGVMLVSLGILSLLNAKPISQYFILVLGISILVAATMQLQNALDLKAMKDKMWPLLLVLAPISLLCAGVIISNPFKQTADLEQFTYVVLVIEGLLSLLSLLYLSIRIRQYQQNAEQIENTIENQEETEESEINEAKI